MTDFNTFTLIGGGGHAAVLAEAALLLGHGLGGFFDDSTTPRLLLDRPTMTRMGTLREAHAALARPRHSIVPEAWILATGDVTLRRSLLDAGLIDLTPSAGTLIHPTAWVSPSATLGRGVFVGPGAIIHTAAHIADHAIINSGSIIEHHARVGENSHIAPGSILGGAAVVGRDVLMGIASRMLPGAKVGDHATVGAGALVLKEVAAGDKVVGVPARRKER